MKITELTSYIGQLLKVDKIRDYCPNGLQVEGTAEVGKVITGVTASEALIDVAIRRQASTLLVHHGYFWKGESSVVTGMKKRRLSKLLKHDINLLAYHLPLDVHPELGNNVQLANLLGIEVQRGLDEADPFSVALVGRLIKPMSAEDFAQKIHGVLGRKPLFHGAGEKLIESIAWCTGGGQSFIEQAGLQGIDAFISGEVSERTIHESDELGIAFYGAGHHATERYGVKALGEHIAQAHGLDVEFVDLYNPA